MLQFLFCRLKISFSLTVQLSLVRFPIKPNFLGSVTRECGLICVFICYHHPNVGDGVHCVEEVCGAVKSLQKKRAQWEVIMRRSPVGPQTDDENVAFMFPFTYQLEELCGLLANTIFILRLEWKLECVFKAPASCNRNPSTASNPQPSSCLLASEAWSPHPEQMVSNR